MNYKQLAREARIKVLSMVHKAQTSHIASNFSVIDVATVIYNNLKENDLVFWSKGWAAASVYYFLAKQGQFPYEDLDKFPNKPYLALAETYVNGVLVSGGSMGHGLPVAVGAALAKKKAKEKGMVYCIMGDGEMQEGTTWEAAQIAAHHKLNNLIVLVDYNKWSAMGLTNDICNLEPFEDRWKGFNWGTNRIDGHNYEAISDAISYTLGSSAPSVIICDTIKGKGVSFFENPPEHKDMGDTGHLYHYKYIDEDLYNKALAELNEKL